MASSDQPLEIPKECKAGVVYNEGPDFEVKVEMVPVPEPGKINGFFLVERHTPVHFNRTVSCGNMPIIRMKLEGKSICSQSDIPLFQYR
jgi:hypothetical protein